MASAQRDMAGQLVGLLNHLVVGVSICGGQYVSKRKILAQSPIIKQVSAHRIERNAFQEKMRENEQ